MGIQFTQIQCWNCYRDSIANEEDLFCKNLPCAGFEVQGTNLDYWQDRGSINLKVLTRSKKMMMMMQKKKLSQYS